MPNTVSVIVDADACPRGAMAIIRRLEHVYSYTLITVSSFNHVIGGANHVTVGNGPDEADLAVVNRITPGDIVVTQDWGLAALCLARGARVISPKGLIFNSENIEFLLDERYAKAKHRRQGGRTRGPAARTAADDQAFEDAFRSFFSI